ncbi:MAG: bifunctional adenosylcobinamide kinase/adenosylcobinamide-phosphate guanylyltransferase [Treponema sp.]|nr:bifunctional adenosylcobinamide kinase/adenosylcobinamide-phosphate guanylyltransferase [Treponema sp.]
MKYFISGGCKNGKSYLAQRLARAQQSAGNSEKTCELYYIATMLPADAEDNERIARHRRERGGWGFTTIEQPYDIENILEKCGCRGSFLLDSLTALLANEMFLPDGAVNENAQEKIEAGLLKITASVKNIVIVSDYIYSDAVIFDPLTEQYRKSLAGLDRAAAKNCDTVLEAAYGNVIVHKGI